jgi:hypothetical protein
MVLSFTFLEMGQLAISDGSAWLTPVCVRTSMINKVVEVILWGIAVRDFSLCTCALCLWHGAAQPQSSGRFRICMFMCLGLSVGHSQI